MATKRVGRPPQDAARQLERAHRILDAAGELIMRWGYDKTTIDDVARQADVAKGTIYLHWRTREDLFAALLRRERVDMLRAVRQAVPDGGMLHDLLKLMAVELLKRPLMKASMLSDSAVLGKLTKLKRTRESSDELKAGFETYFGVLMKHGALRPDLTPTEHVNVIVSVIYGFLCMPQLLPEALVLPDDRLAELLAEAATRTVELGGPYAEEDVRAISRASVDYLDEAVAAAERKLHASLGTKERVT